MLAYDENDFSAHFDLRLLGAACADLFEPVPPATNLAFRNRLFAVKENGLESQ
jgi:hypothetical protein